MLSRLTVTPPFFYPKRRAEDKAGRSPAKRESRGNGWHTTLQGWIYEPKEGEEIPRLHLAFTGCSPAG